MNRVAAFIAGASLVVLLGVFGVRTAVNMPFEIAAALGALGTKIAAINKFGFSGDIDTAEESVWDADDLPTAGAGPGRCFVNVGTTAAAFYLSSDHEDDAGLEVTVEVLDSTWGMSMIDVTLGTASASGTLFVQIGNTTMLRINRMFPKGAALTGNIYAGLDDVDGGTDGIPDTPSTDIVAVITQGEDQTLQACYTVPLGFSATIKTLEMSNIANAGANSVTFRIRKSIAGAANRTQKLFTLANGVFRPQLHDPPLVFVEKTDIEMTADSSGNNASVSATFDIIIFPNTTF